MGIHVFVADSTNRALLVSFRMSLVIRDPRVREDDKGGARMTGLLRSPRSRE